MKYCIDEGYKLASTSEIKKIADYIYKNSGACTNLHRIPGSGVGEITGDCDTAKIRNNVLYSRLYSVAAMDSSYQSFSAINTVEIWSRNIPAVGMGGVNGFELSKYFDYGASRGYFGKIAICIK